MAVFFFLRKTVLFIAILRKDFAIITVVVGNYKMIVARSQLAQTDWNL